MGEEYAWVKVLGILAIFASLVVSALRYNLHKRIKEQAIEENLKEAIKDGVASGLLNEHGEKLCQIGCGQVATRLAVRTGRSWIDKIPILSTFNRLYAMPWRYTVVEVDDFELYYCATHRRAAEQRLNQAHASMRSDHAAFNHTQEQKIAMLEQGGLDQLLREDSDRIKRSIGLGGSISRALGPQLLTNLGEAEEVHVLPVRTTQTNTNTNTNANANEDESSEK